jgi:predicted anti-sigma-YlaC factor YlaD
MNDHLTTDILIDFFHRALAPEDDALVHEHLGACAECRRDYDLEAALSETLRKAARAEEREMPAAVLASVRQRIRTARPSSLERVRAAFRPAIALPVAAALLIGGFFASPLSRPSSQPTIDAMYYFETHAGQQVDNPFAERGSAAQAVESSMWHSDGTPTLADIYRQGGVAAPDARDSPY